ncbi:cyanase [Alkalibacillus silvisoli]|uniref:Cyanate hydratase n=1 Tax=Alkalibacillus silvisoli TaxID=392823 RepID=A0ABP3K0I0_9BACI
MYNASHDSYNYGHINGPHHTYPTHQKTHPIPMFNSTREELTNLLLAAKESQQLSFDQIAQDVGGSKEWIAAVLLGQQSMNADDAIRLTQVLHVDPYIANLLQRPPIRGSLDQTVPTDTLIYRFYEIMQVYGTTFKALINEMFGDGIMSSVNLEIGVDKKPDPEGERVVITLDGKFLPYEKW